MLDNIDKIVCEIEIKVDGIKEKEDVSSWICEEDVVVSIKLKENFEDIDKCNYFEVKVNVDCLICEIGGNVCISLIE